MSTIFEQIFRTIVNIALALVGLIAIRQLVGIICAFFFRRKECEQLARWFSDVREKLAVASNSYIHIENSLCDGITWNPFSKYLQVTIFLHSQHEIELAREMGMGISDLSKPGKPLHMAYYVIKRSMTGLERTILLYRLYDRIEEQYKQDRVHFRLFGKEIVILVNGNKK